MVRFHTGSATIDDQLNIIRADDPFRNFVGPETPRNLAECVVEEDLATLREAVENTVVDGKAMFCCRIRREGAGQTWVIMQTILAEGQSSGTYLELSMQDVTEFDEVQTVAKDVTTGLLTKEEIIHSAHQMLLNPPEHGVYMCIVDIDNFKGINDSYGHLTGDLVLRTVSDIILRQIEGKGLAGRIGGDEIMMILNHIVDKEELRVVLKEIRVGIEDQFKEASIAKGVTVSIGAVLYPAFAQNYDDSFKIADKMLYRAKDKGKNRYIIYTPEIHGDVLNTGAGKSSTEVRSRETIYDRQQLIYQLMEKFMAHVEWSIELALINVGNTFGLDGIIVYRENLEKSFCAYRRIRIEEGRSDDWEMFQDHLTFASDLEFLKLFNEYKCLVIDDVESIKDRHAGLYEYLKERGIRHTLIYHMTMAEKEGFVFLSTCHSLSRKLSASDVKDLAYVSRMVEIAMSDR